MIFANKRQRILPSVGINPKLYASSVSWYSIKNRTQFLFMSYKENLETTKVFYPFDNWRELFYPDKEGRWGGMEQYSPENCDKAQKVFDDLIENLIKAGEGAPQPVKVNFFRTAIETLNALNDEISGLIETGEREDLCELIDKITIASGLNPADYGDGEGIADECREW